MLPLFTPIFHPSATKKGRFGTQKPHLSRSKARFIFRNGWIFADWVKIILFLTASHCSSIVFAVVIVLVCYHLLNIYKKMPRFHSFLSIGSSFVTPSLNKMTTVQCTSIDIFYAVIFYILCHIIGSKNSSGVSLFFFNFNSLVIWYCSFDLLNLFSSFYTFDVSCVKCTKRGLNKQNCHLLW